MKTLSLWRFAGVCFAFLALSASPAAAQTTRVVDVDGQGTAASCDAAGSAFTTVGDALAASGAGDTILVCPGTYVGNINFAGKAVTLRSVSGPAVTILDGNASGSVVTFNTGETALSVLEGFTIRNGVAPFEGGGIQIYNASPIVRANVIVGNRGCSAPGISSSFGSPLIEENTIANNIQAGCSGGTLGGGILISGNSAAVVRRNNIHHNGSVYLGGGISLFSSGPATIEHNVIWANTAQQGGGIGMVNDSDANVIGNLIVGNSAAEGGGVYASVPSGARGPLLVNNTIADNDSPLGSGVLSDGFDTGTRLFNNLIVAAAGQTAVYCGSFSTPSAPSFNFNNVFSASGQRYAGDCTDQTGSQGNISADPQFAGPGDYHLSLTSPNIDAGDNGAPGLGATDLDNHSRVLDGNNDGSAIVDIGADESPSGAPGTLPGVFGKAAPANLASVPAAAVSLTWTASSESTGYEYCYDTIDNGHCDGLWLPSWSRTDATLTDLVGSTTYYWHVRAHNSSGTTFAEGDTSAYWAFSTQPTRIIAFSGPLQFFSVAVGTTSTRTLTVFNNGSAPLTVTGITYPPGFSGAWTGSIPAGGSQNISVTFAPTAPVTYTGNVTVSADQTSGMTTVPVSGWGMCMYSLPINSFTLSSRASNLSVNVDTPGTCSWTVQSQADWIAVAGPASGSGPSSIALSVAANPTEIERLGVVMVGSAPLLVRQGPGAPTLFFWQHQTEGYLSAWAMRGPTLVSGTSLTAPQVTDTNWKIVGSGDFNGDGKPDLFWQNQQTRLMTVWLMNGTTFVVSGLLSPNMVSDSHWAIRAIADMNGDGKPDIVWQHETEGWLSAWIMDGLVMKEGVALTPNRVDPSWRIAAAADVNQDGQTDLIWQNDRTGVITTWLMNRTSFAGTGFSTVAGTTWRIKGVLDIDGDRRPDFIWHNQSSGALIVWYMDGQTFLSSAALTPGVVSPVWQLVVAR